MSHPSDLALEQHLLDRARHGEHVAQCARCQERLARMEEDGQRFRQFVYPATLGGLEQAPGRRWGWGLVLAPVGVAAAAALVMIAQRPAADYVGTKGAALKLTVYSAGPSGARTLSDGDQVPASAALRFKVQSSAPCNLTLLAVDDEGEVSRIVDRLQISGEQVLPGGAVLDGRAGHERLFAVCAPDGAAGLDGLAREAALRGNARLSDLPAGSSQASVRFEKKP